MAAAAEHVQGLNPLVQLVRPFPAVKIGPAAAAAAASRHEPELAALLVLLLLAQLLLERPNAHQVVAVLQRHPLCQGSHLHVGLPSSQRAHRVSVVLIAVRVEALQTHILVLDLRSKVIRSVAVVHIRIGLEPSKTLLCVELRHLVLVLRVTD